MIDSLGQYRRADYESFSLGPAPDYKMYYANFSSGRNWRVGDGLASALGQTFAADGTDTEAQHCVEERFGSAGW